MAERKTPKRKPKAGKRGCHGVTKKGALCDTAPVKGEKFCMGHLPREKKEALGFGGSQPNSGRPVILKPTQVARLLVERNVIAIFRPHFRALGFDLEESDDGSGVPRVVEIEGGGAKLHGTSKEGVVRVSEYEDLGAMIQAAERLLDRAVGRPKQSTEISGEVATRPAIDLSKLSEEQIEALEEIHETAGVKLDG